MTILVCITEKWNPSAHNCINDSETSFDKYNTLCNNYILQSPRLTVISEEYNSTQAFADIVLFKMTE